MIINHERSKAQPLPRSQSGAQTAARRENPTPRNLQISSRLSAIRPALTWRCSECGNAVSKEDVVSGPAKLVGEQVCCAACVERGQANKTLQSRKRTALICLGIMTAASVVIFPAQLTFIALAASLVSVAVGVLGFTLTNGWRLGLIGVGASAFVLCIVALPWQTAGVDEVDTQYSAVLALMRDGDLYRAQRATDVLESMAPGSPKAGQRATELRGIIDRWYADNYGSALTPPERDVFTALACNYGVKTAHGALRVKAIHIDNDSIVLAVRLEREPRSPSTAPQPSGTDAEMEAQAIGMLNVVIESAPANVETITLDTTCDDDPSWCHSYQVSRREWTSTSSSQRRLLLSKN